METTDPYKTTGKKKKKGRKRITDIRINAWAFHTLTVQLAKISIGGNRDLAQ